MRRAIAPLQQGLKALLYRALRCRLVREGTPWGGWAPSVSWWGRGPQPPTYPI